MLRRNATPWWLFVSLLCMTALASAQSPARHGVVSGPAADVPGIAGQGNEGNAPEVPIADPQRSPANILEDGPRDVGTKIDPTVCHSRPLPDDVLAQCRRWLLIASTSARAASASGHAATPQGNAHTVSYRQAARA